MVTRNDGPIEKDNEEGAGTRRHRKVGLGYGARVEQPLDVVCELEGRQPSI